MCRSPANVASDQWTLDSGHSVGQLSRHTSERQYVAKRERERYLMVVGSW